MFLKNGKELKKPEFKIMKLLNMDKEKDSGEKDLDWVTFKPRRFQVISPSRFNTKSKTSRANKTKNSFYQGIPSDQ